MDILRNLEKSALVTGCSGQDGAYLCSLLLNAGYKVVGSTRSKGIMNPWRLLETAVLNHPNFVLLELDLTKLDQCVAAIKEHSPREVYNLSAQSFLPQSFENPLLTTEATAWAPLNLLEAIRLHKPDCRFFQASSSEMYDGGQSVSGSPLDRFRPTNPYASSKLFAHWLTTNYRENFGIFAVSGVLFNHESPLRSPQFASRKISKFVSKLTAESSQPLELGNLEAERDWGFAPDFVEGIHAMLQHSHAEDFVLATGEMTSIRSFVEMCFEVVGRRIVFRGSGQDETGFDDESGQVLVRVKPELMRKSSDFQKPKGDFSKAQLAFGWRPKHDVREIAQRMVISDLERNKGLGN